MTPLLYIFLKGLALGFTIAMVVGPIGILCIQQTLSHGFWAGMAVGLGAATADGIFAAVSGIGLCFVVNILVNQQLLLNLLGGIFLGFWGLKILLTREQKKEAIQVAAPNLTSLFVITILLTLTNPLTIVSFSALLTTFQLTNPDSSTILYVLTLLSSFFLGSLAWWLILTSCLSMFRAHVSPHLVRRINIIAGIALICFGLVAIGIS